MFITLTFFDFDNIFWITWILRSEMVRFYFFFIAILISFCFQSFIFFSDFLFDSHSRSCRKFLCLLVKMIILILIVKVENCFFNKGRKVIFIIIRDDESRKYVSLINNWVREFLFNLLKEFKLFWIDWKLSDCYIFELFLQLIDNKLIHFWIYYK